METDTKHTNTTFSVSGNLVPYQIPKKEAFNGIMFIAECPGAEEDKAGKPLVGKAGKMFDGWLEQVGINRSECIISNVFRYRPDDNKVTHFFATEKSAKEQNIAISKDFGKCNSKYVVKHFELELHQLYSTIIKYKPTVIVPMGAIALWALFDNSAGKITQSQGIAVSHLFHSKDKNGTAFHKCIVVPSFHPANAMPNRNPDNEKLIVAAFKLAQEKSLK